MKYRFEGTIMFETFKLEGQAARMSFPQWEEIISRNIAMMLLDE